METTSGKSEHLIQNVVGCGPFQVGLVVSVCLFTKMASAFSFTFMSFGNFNPGWRCLDQGNNNTENPQSAHNASVAGWYGANGTGQYITDNCPLFESCQQIEYDPTSSTILTEWNLLCDNAWIGSIIISVQMFGVLIGSLVAGVLADGFGRKKVLYISQACTTLLNAGAAFCTTWQTFAALRFLIGLSIAFHANLYYVYTVEFLTKKWRAAQAVMPWYPFNAMLFGVTCLVLKDWRQIHIATAVVAGVGFLPFFWVPESLRWLEVKNKMSQFESTAMRMAKYNRKSIRDVERVVMEGVNPGKTTSEPTDEEQKGDKNANNNNMLRDIIRLFGKQYRKYTLLFVTNFFAVGSIYYAIGFGVKSLGGDFYTNLILLYGAEVVFDFLFMFIPNILGRKKSGVLFAGCSGLCLLTAACIQDFAPEVNSAVAVAALAMAGNITINAFWNVMLVLMTEIYPTVVRGMATSLGLTFSRLGGIIAPVLIPKDESTFFECYAIMGVLGILCALTIFLMPETKGRELANTFQDNARNNQSQRDAFIKGRESDGALV